MRCGAVKLMQCGEVHPHTSPAVLHEPVDQAEQPVPPVPAGVDGTEAREVIEEGALGQTCCVKNGVACHCMLCFVMACYAMAFHAMSYHAMAIQKPPYLYSTPYLSHELGNSVFPPLQRMGDRRCGYCPSPGAYTCPR